jgi:hypothetical protein
MSIKASHTPVFVIQRSGSDNCLVQPGDVWAEDDSGKSARLEWSKEILGDMKRADSFNIKQAGEIEIRFFTGPHEKIPYTTSEKCHFI